MKHKGRGAVSNRSSRFMPFQSEPDGGSAEGKPASVFYREQAVSIITRNQSPDVPFDYSINPYRGCEHGCIYCFARPNHAYVDLSPGLDFETRIFVKENAAERLERSLRRPGYRPSPITLGTATDPYQPVEAERRIPRQLLQVLVRYRHPFSLITKSTLVTRDLDLLAEAARHDLVSVVLSITTLDNPLKARLEPRTASGEGRLRAVAALAGAGVPVGVMVAPLIPWINDGELETILERSRQAGAGWAGYILLRLPREVAPLFEEWLQAHYPQRTQRVLNTLRECRGGQLYRSEFGSRMRGEGVYARLLGDRFRRACERLELSPATRPQPAAHRFRIPVSALTPEQEPGLKPDTADSPQLTLFDNVP